MCIYIAFLPFWKNCLLLIPKNQNVWLHMTGHSWGAWKLVFFVIISPHLNSSPTHFLFHQKSDKNSDKYVMSLLLGTDQKCTTWKRFFYFWMERNFALYVSSLPAELHNSACFLWLNLEFTYMQASSLSLFLMYFCSGRTIQFSLDSWFQFFL